VAQLRLILRIVPPNNGAILPCKDQFLAYIQRFDVVGRQRDPITGMYMLKRSTRADHSRLGDIIPVSQIRLPVDVAPQFGFVADTRLTKASSMEHSTNFLLVKYFTKDSFYILHADADSD